MSTGGYTAYRYRRRHKVVFNKYDSYPSGLGMNVVSSIPRDPAEFLA